MIVTYDDEAGTLNFSSNNVDICTTTVEKFNFLYSQGFATLQSSFMPPAVRLISSVGDNVYMIFQQKPQYRRVEYSPSEMQYLDLNGTNVFQYYLPIPWTLYVVKMNRNYAIEDIWGYFTNGPGHENFGNTELYQIPMHNWYNDNKLCRPTYANVEYRQTTDLLTVINDVHNEVWTTGFNNDLHDTLDDFVNTSWEGSWIPSKSRKMWKSNLHKNHSAFYDYFYRFWSTLPMKTVVNAGYKPIGLLQNNWNLALDESTDIFSATEFKSRLLTAAQNSSIL